MMLHEVHNTNSTIHYRVLRQQMKKSELLAQTHNCAESQDDADVYN